MSDLGLYIHIPWCIKKCPYCDFNSHAVKSNTPEDQYIATLLNDLQQDLELLEGVQNISSIFIGGGTPSLFSAQSFDVLLKGIAALVSVDKNVEITLEANPGTFESQKFIDYRKVGINRLSIGIQSFNDLHLKKLGRVHSSSEALTAVEIAQKAGFDNVNLDLMFGLPDQSNAEMLTDMKTAIGLNPSHLSFYQLTLEPNTYFYQFPPQLPQDDLIYEGQVQCQTLLAESGYQQYEISAYAQEGRACQHNLNYWGFGDYLGVGAGAHGKLSTSKHHRVRTFKSKSPEQYLNHRERSVTPIKAVDLPLEYVMNQLRLKAGFSLEHYQQTTGLMSATLEPALSQCIQKGLLIKEGRLCRCTEKGWNFIDDILGAFVGE
ncbi:MAG: radical SAM family heme chaperone HemW [Methylococcales bacterium]|nr:radical SAM family heme chaperone HemW [Methylococcales bacterium]